MRITLALLLALTLISCGTTNDGLDEDQSTRSRYAGMSGESPVGVIPAGTLRDNERGRDLAFSIEYPTKAGTYPVIFFSTGFAASQLAYVPMTAHWASQGYVVVRVNHAETRREGQNFWTTQTPPDWRNRVRDVTYLLDSLDALQQQYPELQGKIDRTKIGVAGHGYGAFTAMLIGGARTFPGPVNYADPRVKAVIVMSPHGPGEVRGLTNESFAEMRLPTLFMTGTNDQGPAETETPEWRRQAFELAPAGDKWLVVLANAGQEVFTGVRSPTAQVVRPTDPGLGDPMDPRRNPAAPPRTDPRAPGRESNSGVAFRGMAADIRAISLAFWDTYLGANAEGRTALEGAGARGGVELVRK